MVDRDAACVQGEDFLSSQMRNVGEAFLECDGQHETHLSALPYVESEMVMSYAEMDLAMVPAAAPTLKNHLATSCPAPISAKTPYQRGFKFTSRAYDKKTFGHSMMRSSSHAGLVTSRTMMLRQRKTDLSRCFGESLLDLQSWKRSETESVNQAAKASFKLACLVRASSSCCCMSGPGHVQGALSKLGARTELLGVLHQP